MIDHDEDHDSQDLLYLTSTVASCSLPLSYCFIHSLT